MDIWRVAAIAVSNRDFPDFATKMDETCKWLRLAAKQGCDLAVLPETLNRWRGDGPLSPVRDPIEAIAMPDWEEVCAPLIDCAAELSLAFTLPLVIPEGEGFVNCFYLYDGDQRIGRYVKRYPTPGELEAGVQPGNEPPTEWRGRKIGGAICFDLNFHNCYADQVAAGAEIFLCPSLQHGGDQVNYYAARFVRPVVLSYPAWSRVIDRLGHNVAAIGYRLEALRFGYGIPIAMADVNFDAEVFHFDFNHQCIEPVISDHGDVIDLTFDQDNARFQLASRSEDLTVADLVAEYGLVPLRHYLDKAEADAADLRR